MSGVVTGTTGGGTATGVVEDVSPDGGVDVDIAGVLVSRVDEAVGVVDEIFGVVGVVEDVGVTMLGVLLPEVACRDTTTAATFSFCKTCFN